VSHRRPRTSRGEGQIDRRCGDGGFRLKWKRPLGGILIRLRGAITFQPRAAFRVSRMDKGRTGERER
jgi:hypothetical protein